MIFEGFSEKLQVIVKKLKGNVRISEKDLKEIIREIKLAFLAADVNFKVVKDFTNKISEKAIGKDVTESLTPGQQIIKIVHQELIELLGRDISTLTFSKTIPSIYLLVGLQGSGKTTTAAKLAAVLKKQSKKPLLVACDVHRPAAIKQLEIVGNQLNIPVFSDAANSNPVEIAKESIEYAKINNHDVVIIDTAGRLHIDEDLMQELLNIKSVLTPHEILLVVDSMTGQDAVNVADNFNVKLGIDGIILTKLDGDTRGGAALSVKSITGKPIKFIGIGEKLSDLENFYPDRMASRILGMGDVLSLIEKAEFDLDEKKAIELEEKIRKNQFTLDDFLDQFQKIKKMGSLNQILSMLPGFDSKMLQNINMDDKKILHMEAIIKSMTKKERNKPEIINFSRRKRISSGSGTSLQEINKLLTDFEAMRKMLKMFSNPGKNGMKNAFKNLGLLNKFKK